MQTVYLDLFVKDELLSIYRSKKKYYMICAEAQLITAESKPVLLTSYEE